MRLQELVVLATLPRLDHERHTNHARRLGFACLALAGRLARVAGTHWGSVLRAVGTIACDGAVALQETAPCLHEVRGVCKDVAKRVEQQCERARQASWRDWVQDFYFEWRSASSQVYSCIRCGAC